MFCRILVDGQELAEVGHGGYTPFWVDVPASNISGTRELIVIADNRFDLKRTPTHYVYYDFYQYGGLIRAVTLHELPSSPSFIQRVEAYPLFGADKQPNGSMLLKIVVGRVGHHSEFKQRANGNQLTFTYSWDNHSSTDGQFTATFPVGSKSDFEFEKQLSLNHPRIWSPANPQLHTLTVRLLQFSKPATRSGMYHGEGNGGRGNGNYNGGDFDLNDGDAADDDYGHEENLSLIAGSTARVLSVDAGSNVADSIRIRFGLRTVSTSANGRAVAINGKPIKLKGFNRHDLYPQYGPTLPVAVYQQGEVNRTRETTTALVK
jgi:beta-galactosidase/beta-glucuronidase